MRENVASTVYSLNHKPSFLTNLIIFIALKHGGKTVSANLGLACFDCNRFKGSDIASLDPISGELVALFNPRKQTWSEHFRLNSGEIIPLTAVGRATEAMLRLNLFQRVEARQRWCAMGLYP